MNNGRYDNGLVPKTIETAALPERYLLVKNGSDDTVVELCGANEVACGVAYDQGLVGGEVAVETFGGCADTKLVVAGENITGTPFLIPGVGGKAVAIPTAAGTYEVFGSVVKGALEDDYLSFYPCQHQRVVS